MAYSPDLVSYGFSGIVLLGGIFGYIKAGMCVCTIVHKCLHAWSKYLCVHSLYIHIFYIYIYTNCYHTIGSLMSLGSGVVFGSLLAYGAYRTSVNPKDFLFIFGKCSVALLL